MKTVGMVVLSLVAAFMLVACGETSTKQTFRATLSGSQEVPPVTTAGAGSATVELNDKVMTLTGTYSALSGDPTMAHIHGPAAEGVNAGVLFPLTVTPSGTGAGSLSGTATLTDAQIADLKAGLWYVNVHTGNNPGGEVRGQLK